MVYRCRDAARQVAYLINARRMLMQFDQVY